MRTDSSAKGHGYHLCLSFPNWNKQRYSGSGTLMVQKRRWLEVGPSTCPFIFRNPGKQERIQRDVQQLELQHVYTHSCQCYQVLKVSIDQSRTLMYSLLRSDHTSGTEASTTHSKKLKLLPLFQLCNSPTHKLCNAQVIQQPLQLAPNYCKISLPMTKFSHFFHQIVILCKI